MYLTKVRTASQDLGGDLLGGKKSSDIPPSLNVNGKNVEDLLTKAGVFNSYFGDTRRKLASKIDQPNQKFPTFLYKSRKVPSTITLILPTVNETLNQLNCLNSKKASGYDDLAPFFIKTASLIIALYLTYFLEFMLNHGLFQNILKIA